MLPISAWTRASWITGSDLPFREEALRRQRQIPGPSTRRISKRHVLCKTVSMWRDGMARVMPSRFIPSSNAMGFPVDFLHSLHRGGKRPLSGCILYMAVRRRIVLIFPDRSRQGDRLVCGCRRKRDACCNVRRSKTDMRPAYLWDIRLFTVFLAGNPRRFPLYRS